MMRSERSSSMRTFGLMVLLAAVLAAPLASAGKTERPVSGVITAIDEDDRMIWVGPVAFYVPRDVYDFEDIEEGLFAIVYYVRSVDGRTAVKLEPHVRVR